MLRASENETQANSELAHRISSSASRDRPTMAWAQQKPYSDAKSRAPTASIELANADPQPSRAAVAAGSSGNEDPPAAEAPRGDSRIRSRASRKRRAPRSAAQAWAAKWWPSDTGCACWRWV